MIDYMSLEEQVDVDFGRARRKAFLRWAGTVSDGRWCAWLT